MVIISETFEGYCVDCFKTNLMYHKLINYAKGLFKKLQRPHKVMREMGTKIPNPMKVISELHNASIADVALSKKN